MAKAEADLVVQDGLRVMPALVSALFSGPVVTRASRQYRTTSLIGMAVTDSSWTVLPGCGAWMINPLPT